MKLHYRYLVIALPISIFFVCSAYLQTQKTPWVDECYTYYGVTHKNLEGFFESICSGVNFSPPLYFFINWIIQLFLNISIDFLRIESALWISLGTFLVFLKCAKSFGTASAFLGCTLVLLQSNLLLEQALEARHYGMLYACSAWVLFLIPNNHEFNSRRQKTIYFTAHFALSCTHYFGIIFSVLTGIIRFWHHRKKKLKESLPIPEISSCVLALPIYLFLLSLQSSHLGHWPKSNDFPALLNIFSSSLLPITLIIPILLFLLFVTSCAKRTAKSGSAILIRICIIWLLTPLMFWSLSHLSSLNLFKDRYFIAKEAAVMIIASYVFHKTITLIGTSKLPFRSILFPAVSTFLFCILLILLTTKRRLYGFDASINYHNRLLSSERIINHPLPKIYCGDHLFFPNNYLAISNADLRLVVHSPDLIDVYQRFNPSIKTSLLEPGLPTCLLIVDREMPFSVYRNGPQYRVFESNDLFNCYKINFAEEI